MHILRKHVAFIAALTFVVGAFVFMIVGAERTLQGGDTIILATRPVDPRDLFRGEYVILRYEIETDTQLAMIAQAGATGEKVYVELVPDERGVARVVSATFTPPSVPYRYMLVGEIENGGNAAELFLGNYIVRFPQIEQYYVPEGAGKPIERMTELHVEVALRGEDAQVVRLLDSELVPVTPTDYLAE